MPDQNEMLLGQPEYSELLMRALFLKGDLPQYVGLPYAAVLQLADLTAPEYMHLRRWRRFMGRIAQAAQPALFSIACFGRTSQNRDTMAVIEQIWVRTPVAGAVRFAIEGDTFGLGDTVPATTGFYAQDDRSATLAAAATATFGASFTNNAASAVSGAAAEIITGTSTIFCPIDPTRPLILTNKPINNTAKSYLYVQPTGVNQGIDVTFFWRERPILETEL